MGENHSSVMVLWIEVNFWWTTTQSMSHNLNGGGRERASKVPDLHFKIYNLGPNSAFFA